ncbi:protein cramped [Drosophila albomicans]|uniref:Protein cramped n=1 Tax=Drosophila albomicans TaxID=7291 RepID=A0A6P8W432_DROAB|nr:protein cramped [Drosophila albomicans]
MEETNSMCKNVATTILAVPETASSLPSPSTTSLSTSSCKAAMQFKLAAEEPEELLGSVTTQNCPGTRASARVIQKMKLDLTRPMTPPPAEREHGKKEEKGSQKTPSQMRAANKTTWTNVERNCFFDALNEFGKDFEAVANCINSKLKRRNANSEYSFKSKDQVRQHYYQTYHKISKYVRYSDELKKPAQELYTLINYGEMRRKLQFLTEKHFMKLKQLIYQGHIIVRCKGKNIRIKTPSCKALRRLNQLDDTLEDIRLPSKIEVLVTPANMEAFGRVQSLAQNPRARAIVPLHKKLISFIKTFQYKWRSFDVRLAEEQLLPPSSAVSVEPTTTSTTVAVETAIVEPALCLLPKPGVPIHRPLLSITAYLSSVNICLTAYEERLGVKVRSETVESTAAAAAASAKRARTESGSEKRSPEAKKLKPQCSPAHEKSADELALKLENSSGDELSEEINELLSQPVSSSEAADTTIINSSSLMNAVNTTGATAATPVATAPTTTAAAAAPTRAKRNDAPGAGGGKGSRAANAAAAAAARNFKPLLSDEVIKRIRKGWTVSTSADITIGDLYVVLGQDSKLELEYYWCDAELSTASSSTSVNATIATTNTTSSPASTSSSLPSTASSTSLPYNTNDCDSVERVKAIQTATVSNKLKHLLLVANLSERVRKRQCNCGHSCDRKRDLITKAQWLNSLANGTASVAGAGVGAGAAAASGVASHDSNESIFRTPMIPMRRPISSLMDPVRQLSKLTRQKMSRQVLVQRCILPAGSDVSRPYDVLSLRNLQNGLFEPIERVSSSSNSRGNGTGNGHISSALANRSGQSLAAQAESSSNSSDSGCIVSGTLDMPNLDFVETTTTLSSALTPASSSGGASLPDGAQDESTTQNFFTGSVSPMHLLRDSTSNARWLEDNINDFSLTSLLGHLDDFDATRDILDPSSSLSVISESSVDFRHKFQEISALLQQQEKD